MQINSTYTQHINKNTYRRQTNFKQIKPEYMFINSFGYDKNMDWAQTAVGIINQCKNLYLKNTKFADLIEFIAQQYGVFYKKTCEYFGQQRTYITGNTFEDKYANYNERAVNYIDENGGVEENTFYKKSFDYSIKSPNNEDIRLSRLYYVLEENPKLARITAPNSKFIDPAMQVTSDVYNEIFDKNLNFKDTVKSTAKIHWLLSQIRPFVRGTAGIADMLCKTIFEAKGIQVSEYKEGVNPNIEAFVTSLDEYCEKYPTFFSKPLEEIKE